MNTIKVYLAESGRIADLKKDFPLYQGQYQNKLLNVFVPTSILAPNFSVQESGNAIADYVSSTAVKIGMRTIERNGKIHISKTYYMRYLKTLTYQNVEYALYERKLPREFTFYAGQGENAPVLIANVVNINNETTPSTIIEITPSQTCSLDVMPSGYLDTDEPIEATALEEINGRLNAIDEDLALKQNIHDDTLETTAKTIVGAINENKGRVDTNAQNIETNRQNIATNRNDIDRLIATSSMGEEYIGQLRGSSLPTEQQLTTFVSDTVDRQPKNGDTIIFIYEIDGETDKNYKYIYSASGWRGYEIPPIENASNGSLGLIEGTYTIEDYDMLVDISGGQIRNIYIKDSSATYRNLVEYLNTTTQDIADIIDGTSVVGEAMKALEDGLGNNIVNTYLTKNLGATKQYVRDYAMPREFNDTYFIATDGYLQQVPTTPESGVQFTATTNNIGDFQLFQISRENKADFELSAKNGYSNNIYVSASVDCVVTFRLTTQYKKLGQDWADLNVELTSPITLTAGEVQKLMFGNPFTYLGEDVITLTDGDMFKQTLEVVTQTSSAIEFNIYSNEIYPSTFNLTVQSYVLSGVEQSESKVIMLGADGVIEANRVVFEVQNAESFVEFRTNQREFLLTALLPIVGELDRSLPVNITFGDTTYNVYSFMKGMTQPITIGDFYSVGEYNQELGYAFATKLVFLETSDYVGFAISPATITANQLVNIIDDTDTIVTMLDPSGTRLQLSLATAQVNKLMRALLTPSVTPSDVELVAINTNNSQVMLSLGDGLYVSDGKLKVVGGGEQGGTFNYPDLDNKPTLNTNNSTSQTPNVSETINGTISLHKVSKTGVLADTIEDSTHRTVTDTEKQTWNNKSNFDGRFTSLTDVPIASEGVAGIIEIATDQEAENGTNTSKAINSKQLLTAIQGLGTVFDLKGTKATIQDLPSTGNEIGDVWYVISEQVGYIWLNDGTTNKWEQFGSPIDLSGYVQYVDIVNNLTSTATNKPLSALQGKTLNDLITNLTTSLNGTNQNVLTNATNISTLQEDKADKVANAILGNFVSLTEQGNLIDSGVSKSNLYNPNLLINGRFTVNQRAIDTKTVNSTQYIVDRWLLWLDSGSVTVSTALSGMTVNNSSNTSRVILRQYLEDGIISQLRRQKITCSVDVGGTIYSFTTTVPISDDNAIRTIGSVSLPIGELRFIETPSAYAVDVYFNAGSYARINYVKMETGENVTPMSITPYGEELAKCQRYFIRLSGSGNYSQFAGGFMYSGSKAFNIVPLPASLRTKPTITHSGNLSLLSVGGYSAFTSLSVDTLSSNLITLTCGGTFTAGNPCFLCSQADASAYIDLDAEIY